MADEIPPRLFDRIYLDSQPLTASGWPRVHAPLQKLLEFAKTLQLPVVIPAPVAAEQVAQFVRNYAAALKQAASTHKAVNRLRVQVDLPEATSDTQDIEAVVAAYRTSVASTLEREGIQTIPLTARPTHEFFEMLVTRQRPFDEDGCGFGDALILFSVIDDLRAVNQRGVLVTTDGDYSGADAVANRHEVSLVVQSVDAATEHLQKHLTAGIRAVVQMYISQARAAIDAHKEGLQEFLVARLEVPVDRFAPVGATVTGVETVEVIGAMNVVVSPAFHQEVGDTARFSAEVRVLLVLEVDRDLPYRSRPRSSPRLRVGEKLSDYSDRMRDALAALKSLASPATAPSSEGGWAEELEHHHFAKALVLVEATAKRADDGYVDVTWVSARLEGDAQTIGDLLAGRR